MQKKQRILIRPIKNGIPDDLWQKTIHSEETKTKKEVKFYYFWRLDKIHS